MLLTVFSFLDEFCIVRANSFQLEKPGTPVPKSGMPTSSGGATPGPSNAQKTQKAPPLGT